MFILDENKLKMLHTLMREKGVHNVNTSMFSEQQRKIIYESYGEQFLMFNGLGYMVNCVVPYALAKNINMVDKKLKQELDYALKQYDYEYAFLCAKLLNDEKMVEFVKQYDVKGDYDKIFNDMNKFVSEARI
ncbi:MAG: hypothetical protein QT11_C0001G0374 [archaeon GW2011_AR20]|nr:MAG: hypothetical protein QT11_C0001G0374 [archaeon GW2011_AR20]AQS28049.1 hypothetical protein [uncultured archaeon]AQS28541.1 hypothetical protein [uncultured archaeon]AQS28651.1 hypothetical protein [uncultured archaeon]MBS3160380.1 hypothetical protein [Candidatus Woesearchaeota archaeon]